MAQHPSARGHAANEPALVLAGKDPYLALELWERLARTVKEADVEPAVLI
jgi:hypothetical protein